MNNIPFLITAIATVVFMKRSNYGWVGSILTGIFASPLIYICVFAIINLGVNLLLGILKVSEDVLSNETVIIGSTVLVITIWLIAGFFMSQSVRAKTKSNQPIVDNG
ncbi:MULTISPECIES: hypothetical protein [unclassified Lentimonas]|uniref:hypothetical protein n=1 Tax=unclassified Lentimonas TaxID=2630993 RepID=UPI0013250A4D|nr:MULTISPECIES: hypothetical protein [unclassified Lentimonas]CAA6680277.1 Unannotated [Lentimonas sp. CC4]CAA6687510.1 Unannotated [Lentimonas sp. CC6]CAA7076336.1 Unannotated [Lentimonas sp. CC4]CAA7172170.1 Unannotated [Lentimonas sp. CC21]CAA7183525.1 Unannotated [Lentimonas sp. CC8]